MRKPAVALVLALLAGLGSFAPGATPAVAAATTNPKVVIIVGATHATTDRYRTYADAAYAEAIKYSSNVVKVYSPNATWANVKAALQGASIVVYMGHGNGFPSPYRTSPWPYSQNGFGLNATAGNGDYNNQYYGEYYIGNEVRLAPNAVVLLNHLCYASGNSEPGNPEPTLSVAKQRADNYAAGFLKAGARTVVADGHMGPEYYIRSLFTTRQTVDQMWRTAPNFHNHAFSFASVRSPGYTVEMDPEQATSGYYRAMTGRLDLRTEDVTGALYASTDVDPATFVVPGAASVAADGAGVFADATLTPDPGTGLPAATLGLDSRVRLLAQAGATAAGAPVFQVEDLDGTTSGFMSAADLTPRDSAAPQVWEVDDGNAALSPNGDGRHDTFTLTARLSEEASWRVRIRSAGVIVWSASGTGSQAAATWSGVKDGAPVPDGTYDWSLVASDGWGNVGTARTGKVVVDTVAPALSALSLPAVTPAATFSPNGDGRADTLAVGFSASEAATVVMAIQNSAGNAVRTLATAVKAGAGSMTWDGRSAAGSIVPDGLYTARIAPRDPAGNDGAAEERTIAVYGALSKVAASTTVFYPQDGDRFSTSAVMSYVLARPATVTWRLTKLDGTVVRTIYTNRSLAAGTYTFRWYGTNDSGARLPVGTYASVVSATNGTVGAVQKTWIQMNAFAVKVTDTTPTRGQSITVTARSAEPLKSAPTLRIKQPGINAWSVRMTKISSSTYRATIRLKASSAGTLVLRVSGYDLDGRWQRVYVSLRLA